jgi:hypothetical protein
MQTPPPHSSNLDQARTAINALQEKATETCKALRNENFFWMGNTNSFWYNNCANTPTLPRDKTAIF